LQHVRVRRILQDVLDIVEKRIGSTGYRVPRDAVFRGNCLDLAGEMLWRVFQFFA
jgi:hypothetical protein